MVDPAKTVIVSKLWADVHQSEVKTLNQLRTMGRLRNLRFAEIAADLMVPGKSTIAYSVVYENDLCLAIDRKAVVDKLKKLKTFFKNHYLILISQTNSNRIFEFSEMIQDEIIIPILFFTVYALSRPEKCLKLSNLPELLGCVLHWPEDDGGVLHRREGKAS
ncbi:hypothetical protein AAMO2058_000726100 [Amorphochlora amoebiformis]